MSTVQPTATPSYRDLWNERGAHSYRIIVDTFAPPIPPIGMELTVQDGEVIKQSIIACDNPSEKYPAHNCAPIRQYYPHWGVRTIEELLDSADSCIAQTRISMSKCPAFSNAGFDRFTSSEAMFDAARTCETYLGKSETMDTLCAVEYEPYFGYPKTLFFYVPGVDDGLGLTTISEFHILPTEEHS
jgi:hypothetical protein